LFSAIGAGVQAAIGILLIAMSRKISEFWFEQADDQFQTNPIPIAALIFRLP
jgi:hypothetical protein